MSSDFELTIDGYLARRAAIDLGGLIDREGGLCSEGDPLWIGHLKGRDLLNGLHQDDVCGASPVIPSTSSWPSWPIITHRVSPRRQSVAPRREPWLTSGQVASIVRRSRAAAFSCTAGATPWAEKTTISPSGTCVLLLDEDRTALGEFLDNVLAVDDLLAT